MGILIQQGLAALARKGLVAVGVLLVERGWTSEDDWMVLSMKAAPILVALAWSLWQKVGGIVEMQAALRLHPGASLKDAKADAALLSMGEKLSYAVRS